jgi:vacuolar-type H+-ATPase subunit H
MSLDAMKKVAEAEAAAKQSMQEANGTSKQLIADAEAQGRALHQQRLAEADSAVKAMMQDAEAQAAKNAEEIMHHAENQCAVLRAHGSGLLDEAADRIVERIVMG